MMRPELKVLRFARVLRPGDFDLLVRLVQVAKTEKVADLLSDIARGNLWAFTTKQGLVLLEIVSVNTETQLYVRGLVGRGIIRQAEEISSDLAVIAREYKCTKVFARAISPAWERICPKIGFRPRVYEMEIA